MALNKYMHPRNIYRKPPDFGKLAKGYSDFANIAKTDVTGKVSIDFKDPHALRVLTKCLLKSDFNLQVDIPEDRLVPTLPLRLNYILWIEDLLNTVKQDGDIWGLDIGTGACAIYPLLAATKFKWHMVATETDDESIRKAQDNIQKNNLQELITLKKNKTSSVVEHLFSEGYEQVFHFSMCNPPFYSSIQELCESRSPARLPPKNGFTGSPHELITEGGELEFCRKFINESKNHKNRVLINTTMVGHKYNLKELIQYLKAESIQHTYTEFCQGRVTRWGLAWTYQNYDITNLVPPRDQPRKKNLPIAYLLPKIPDSPYNVETITSKLKCILNDLKIYYKVINKRGNSIILDVIAQSNTWSNQRRKRRLKKQEDGDSKRFKIDEDTKVDTSLLTSDIDELDSSQTNVAETSVNNISVESTSRKETTTEKEVVIINNDTIEPDSSQSNTAIKSVSTESTSQKDEQTEKESVVHAALKVLTKQNDIIMEMEYLKGTAGKEGLHQIVQYIKNNWK